MTSTVSGVATTTTFAWDAAGNQTSRTSGTTTQIQTWDAEGELAAVTGGAEDVSNVYDADGNRLVRIEEDGATVFLPGGQEVRATATATTATRWYSFAGKTVALRTGTGMAAVRSVIGDANGTAVAYVHNTNWAASVSRDSL